MTCFHELQYQNSRRKDRTKTIVRICAHAHAATEYIVAAREKTLKITIVSYKKARSWLDCNLAEETRTIGVLQPSYY